MKTEKHFPGEMIRVFNVWLLNLTLKSEAGRLAIFTLHLKSWDYAPQQLVFQPVEEDSEQVPLAASVEPTRTIPPGQIVVGSLCIINGRYYADSYGGGSYGNGNGRTVKVSRIVDLSRADPYHVTTESGGALGWTSADCLQVTG